MSVVKKLSKLNLIHPPYDFCTDTHYEVMMGSVAYNVTSDTSDMDVHSICTPNVEMIFPHLTGHINGFGDEPKTFDTYQQHHVKHNNKMYDVVIYSIVKAFNLAKDNNPNVLDMLWVPNNCILHIDHIGKHIRHNRRHFLSKISYHKFRGYSNAQMKRMLTSNRTDLIEKHGYDTKNAYHIVRLLEQCRQILEDGDMDITQCSELLKSIRRGEWSMDRLKSYINEREKALDRLYETSSIDRFPDEKFLRGVLMECIEMKYGSIAQMPTGDDLVAKNKLLEIKKILDGV